jgi:hypothetical protein
VPTAKLRALRRSLEDRILDRKTKVGHVQDLIRTQIDQLRLSHKVRKQLRTELTDLRGDLQAARSSLEEHDSIGASERESTLFDTQSTPLRPTKTVPRSKTQTQAPVLGARTATTTRLQTRPTVSTIARPGSQRVSQPFKADARGRGPPTPHRAGLRDAPRPKWTRARALFLPAPFLALPMPPRHPPGSKSSHASLPAVPDTLVPSCS